MKTLWPFGLRAAYQRDVARLVRAIADEGAEPVRDAELAALPAPVQRYLRFAGVVGRPHVHTIAARMHGRIRSGPEAAWMPIVAEQHNVLAPATLLSPAIAWEAVDGRQARARFTNAGYTIAAGLWFDAAGELVDFHSDDRFRAAPDGRLEQTPWSTPLGAARLFGPVRLPSTGEGRWHTPTGDHAYIELTIDDVRYNVPG